MPLSPAQLEETRTGSRVRIAYGGAPLVMETGAGIPLGGRWWWSFDGSLRLVTLLSTTAATSSEPMRRSR